MGARGRDASGKSVGANHPTAVAWCANGAIEKCYGAAWNRPVMIHGQEHDSPAKKARKLCEARYPLHGTRPGKSLSEVNDRIGYEEALDILKAVNV